MGKSKISSPPTAPARPRGGALHSTGLANALFSRTQQKVLGLLFGQPARSFYTSELIALAAAGSGAVQRELGRLEDAGLVTVQRIGNQKHYQANRAAPVFGELAAIARKTFALAEPLKSALKPVWPRIDAAFVFGSVAKGSDAAGSDVDLFVVSEQLGYPDLIPALQRASARVSRAVNPTVMSMSELQAMLRDGNAFVARVLAQPKLWIKGSDDDLPARLPRRTG
jgi:predicted nucleotidyltransferase